MSMRPALTIFAIVVAVTGLVWTTLPQRDWQTLGPGVFLGLLQIAIAILITDIYMRLYERARVRSVCSIPVGGTLRHIESMLYEFSSERLRQPPRTGRAIPKDLEAVRSTLEWHHKDLKDVVASYRDMMRIDELAPLLRMCRHFEGLIELADPSRCLTESSCRNALCWGIHRILEELRLASGQFSYKAHMGKIRIVEDLLAGHHGWTFWLNGRTSSRLWHLRRLLPF